MKELDKLEELNITELKVQNLESIKRKGLIILDNQPTDLPTVEYMTTQELDREGQD
jgi:hypothetical protein